MRRIISALLCVIAALAATAQINTDQVLRIGRNALYFEDYVLSIQYFNAVIGAKPFLAQPYFYRALAKYNLDDLAGAERDASEALERNPFLTDAYELRGVIRQNLGMTEGAVDDYDSALKLSPYDRGILFNKALALSDIKEFGRADSSFTMLLDAYPGYAEGYLGRARMLLEKGDTLKAVDDITHALTIDRNQVNGYVLRADIAINSNRNFAEALADMDEAIKLQPKYAGFYINRAFLRHELDDYRGAMEDYDYALQLDRLNTVALFNRAMLRAEVHDFNRAIDDLNEVEAIKGRDFRTLYNRAVINHQIGRHKEAEADINGVIEAYPEFAAAYLLRSEIRRAAGERESARADHARSIELARKKVQVVPGANGEIDLVAAPDGQEGESQEAVASRFMRLLTIDDNADMEQGYNNRSIRGRVQDRNSTIEIEPIFTVTYYTSPTELRQSGDFIREVSDLNDSRVLRFLLQVANREPRIDDPDEARRHFESIDYYTSYISTHNPRAIDYFARGMDYMTVRNFPAATADFTRATELNPEFALAWMLRGLAMFREYQNPTATDENITHRLESGSLSPAPAEMPASIDGRSRLAAIVDCFDRVAELVPDMAVNYYNRGIIRLELGDYSEALSDFSRAIRLKPEFGEAFYNRGYTHLKLGDRRAGTADLSRAGELGVVPSYNLLKRMSRH